MEARVQASAGRRAKIASRRANVRPPTNPAFGGTQREDPLRLLKPLDGRLRRPFQDPEIEQTGPREQAVAKQIAGLFGIRLKNSLHEAARPALGRAAQQRRRNDGFECRLLQTVRGMGYVLEVPEPP